MATHATYRHCAQIGPYEYEMETKVMDLTPETTVAEILAWVKRVGWLPENKAVDIHCELSHQPQEAPDDEGGE